MHGYKKTRRRILIAVTTVLAGGTLFGTCEMRVRDALVNGAQTVVSQVLDPTNLSFGDMTTNGAR